MLGVGKMSRLRCRDGPVQTIVTLAEVAGLMGLACSSKGHLRPIDGGTSVGRPGNDRAAHRSPSRSIFRFV
jgi:hypothetical protein